MKNWKKSFILMVVTGGFTCEGIQIWKSDYSAPIFAALGAFSVSKLLEILKIK